MESSSSRGKSRSKSRHRKGICQYCKKEGHWKAECLKLKDKKVKDSSDLARVAKSADNILLVSAISVGDAWILDSGCSYQSIDGGVVLMGNNISCKVIGIGTVQIKMHDGVVRTLTDVRHIPDLKKNLISLGVLDSQSCKYFTQGGVLKGTKGALIVIKGRFINGLYLLQGSTVIGTALVSSSSDLDSDTTRLWLAR